MAEAGTKVVIEKERGTVDRGWAGAMRAARHIGAARYHEVLVELKAPE